MLPGTPIQSKSDRSRRGVVLSVPINRYGMRVCLVRWDGEPGDQECPVNALEPIERSTSAADRVVSGDFDSLPRLLARLTREKLLDPHSDVIYSLKTANADFHPYQFRPVIKLMREDAGGILIADEVGLGKTIEAGYILKELKARDRQHFMRALVVCPASLREKWRLELARRFGEHFEILGAPELERLIDRIASSVGDPMFQAIVSYETLRSKSCGKRIQELGPVDLVICDEAHHLRNQATQAHKVVRQLRKVTKSFVLLSATPIQLHSDNLRSLLSLVAEDRVQDSSGFARQLQANQRLIDAERRVLFATPDNDQIAHGHLEELVGSSMTGIPEPHLRSLIERLESLGGNPDRTARLELAADIREAGPFSTILTRTRRRDVRQDLCVRKPMMVDVAFTDAERTVFDWCLEECRRRYAEATDSRNSIGRTATVNTQRKFTSCLPAFVVELSGASEELDDRDDNDGGEANEWDGASVVPAGSISALRLSMPPDVARAAQSLLESGSDSKYARLLEVIKGLLLKDSTAKVVVFSFYKGTLRYLNRRLSADGIPAVQIDGDVPSHPQRPSLDERGRRIDRFREDPSIRVLLSSEVGSEGLDFQEVCYVVVNYDLPWNPMRIEQRIGRVDRYGQPSKTVIVVNFKIADTVEDRVYHQLLDRIDIFRSSIGDLEEILGDIHARLEAIVMRVDLNDAERAALAADAEQRMASLAQIAREVGRDGELLAGHDSLLDESIASSAMSPRRVSPGELANFVESCLGAHGVRLLPAFLPRRSRAQSWPALFNLVRRSLRNREEAALLESVDFDDHVCELQYEEPRKPNFIEVTHPIVTACIRMTEKATGAAEALSDGELATCAEIKVGGIGAGILGVGAFRLTTVAGGRRSHLVELVGCDSAGEVLPREQVQAVVLALGEPGIGATMANPVPKLSPAQVSAIESEVGNRMQMLQEASISRARRTSALRIAKDRSRSLRDLASYRDQVAAPGFSTKDARYQRMMKVGIERAESRVRELDDEALRTPTAHVEVSCLGFVAVRNQA